MISWATYPPGRYRLMCPACGRGGRDKTLGVRINSDGAGVMHCFRCELVDVSRHGLEARRTFYPSASLPSTKQRSTLSNWGIELWNACIPLSGVALAYLRARHCCIPPEHGDLRWHPNLKHPSGYVGPALVGLITHAVTRQPLSLHRTWITATGKADLETTRLVLGNHSTACGCIRLWPDEEVTNGLGIAEGIETALSLAWGFKPVWATIDAGHMAKFPVLEGVETLTIAQDRDAAGEAAASECANRWAEAGREVLVTQQALNDLNDVLMEVA